MSWNPFKMFYSGAKDALDKAGTSPDKALEDQRRRQLLEQAAASGRFADYGEGGVASLGGQMDTARQNLLDQATGKLSYSREALRQGLAQNQAAQQSMAAGASPLNGPMAARNAAMNMARQGYGLSGQQALAGIAEQQGAAKQYADATLGQRQQDLSAALGGRQTAVSGFGANNTGKPDPSDIEKYGPALIAAFTAMSDRNLKTDIADGDEKARNALDALVAYRFKYRDEKYGKGPQLGVMADELGRVLPQAVVDTPDGKAIDTPKAVGASLAMLASLGKRVSELEGDGPKLSEDAKRAMLRRAANGNR